MRKLTEFQQGVYVNLSQFSREVYNNKATRYDCVSYAVGFYGKVTEDIFEVINILFAQGVIEK